MKEENKRRKNIKNNLNQPIIKNFIYAYKGVKYCIKNERNIRIHITLAIIGILMGLLLRISTTEFALLIITIAIVIICEMINTVTEVSIDLITNDYHHLAEIAKDVAAGAVLVASIFSIFIGAIIFIPHIIPLLRFF